MSAAIRRLVSEDPSLRLQGALRFLLINSGMNEIRRWIETAANLNEMPVRNFTRIGGQVTIDASGNPVPYRILTEAIEPEYDLQAKYAYYNKLLFDNKLPTIPIEWKSMKTAGGIVHYRATRSSRPAPHPLMVRLGRVDKHANYDLKPDSLRMELSPLYKKSEQALDDTLIHEMIHVLMLTTGHIGEGHGPLFHAELRRCSKIVGFEVTDKDHIDGLDLSEEVPIKAYGVVLIAPKDGGKFVYTLMTENTLKANIEALKKRLAYAPRGMNASVLFYVIKDKMWSEKAIRSPVQRKVGKSFALYKGTDPALFADLQKNGKIIDRLD